MIYDMQVESAQGCTLMDNALTAQYNTFKLQRMLSRLYAIYDHYFSVKTAQPPD